MEDLQYKINSLYEPNSKLSLYNYNTLIKQCVNNKEFGATVFVYDHMIKNGVKPNEFTFKTIERLHSKTLPENNNIQLKWDGKTRLQPRRRIHKIIKGHKYSDNYNNALLHLDKIKKYLDDNPELKSIHKDKLAKNLNNNCDITIKDAKYIITNLKRTKYLNNVNQPKITNFFSLDKPIIIDLNN